MEYEVSISYPQDGSKQVIFDYDCFELVFEKTDIGSSNEMFRVGRPVNYGMDDFLEDLRADAWVYPDSNVTVAENFQDIHDDPETLPFMFYQARKEDVRESDAQVSIRRDFNENDLICLSNLEQFPSHEGERAGKVNGEKASHKIFYVSENPNFGAADHYLAQEPLDNEDIEEAWIKAVEEIGSKTRQ
jgi:hypothetical protein